jgi:quercetin dioxygenase-like cupin family protein
MPSTTQTNLSDNTAPICNEFAAPSREARTKVDVWAAAVVLVLTGVTVARAQDMRSEPADAAAAPIVLTPDAIKWQPMPKEWSEGMRPAGFKGKSEVAILQGDPSRPGAPYVIRIRSKAGSQIPPNWTRDDESITVLSGTLCLAVGQTFDENACRDLPAGSFVFMPKGVPHFGVAKGDVIQIQGVGPLKVHWVEPAGVIQPSSKP